MPTITASYQGVTPVKDEATNKYYIDTGVRYSTPAVYPVANKFTDRSGWQITFGIVGQNWVLFFNATPSGTFSGVTYFV